MKQKANNSDECIAGQWDANAETRFGELNSRSDYTYDNVLCPLLFKLIEKNARGRVVLDVGCGLGFFSDYINDRGFNVTGIDISSNCIALAQKNFPTVKFEKSNVIDFAAGNKEVFDACVANMLFHNVPNLEGAATAISKVLKSKGVLVGCIPHPEFWFNNRKSASTPLSVFGETAYLAPFKIHGAASHPSPFTYFDRKEEHYWNALRTAGFAEIEALSIEKNSTVPRDLIFFVASKGRRQNHVTDR